ncbi:MAG: hypothetical protein ACON4O_01560 [Lentimonas sp.]
MKLEKFGAHKKANELLDFTVKDIEQLKDAHGCRRLVHQQVASADSIAAKRLSSSLLSCAARPKKPEDDTGD